VQARRTTVVFAAHEVRAWARMDGACGVCAAELRHIVSGCKTGCCMSLGGNRDASTVPHHKVLRPCTGARAPQQPTGSSSVTRSEAEETTEKYGLEAGLLKVSARADAGEEIAGVFIKSQLLRFAGSRNRPSHSPRCSID
jgi:hypothetical protein